MPLLSLDPRHHALNREVIAYCGAKRLEFVHAANHHGKRVWVNRAGDIVLPESVRDISEMPRILELLVIGRWTHYEVDDWMRGKDPPRFAEYLAERQSHLG